LGPESLGARRRNGLHFREAVDERLLFLRQVVGRPELESHMQISGRARVDPRQSATTKVEDLTALCSRRHLKTHAPGDHRHIDVGSERQLRIRHQHLGIKIFTLALETRIFLDLEHHQDVATRTTARADVADSAHRHVLTGGHSGGNPHHYLLLAAQPSLASALFAGSGDDGSLSGATRARRDAYDLTKKTSLRPSDFARSVTGRAL